MHFTGTEATKMWKDLVDTYQRKIKSGSCGEPLDDKASNWRFFDRMSFLGGLSLHLNHLIASRMANYDWSFGTLPFGLFWSNLDTRDLETYPRTYSGHF